jgi:PAS domain-containing protein
VFGVSLFLGLGSGLLAVIVSALISAFLFIGRPLDWAFSASDGLLIILYVLIGSAIAMVCDALRRSVQMQDDALARYRRLQADAVASHQAQAESEAALRAAQERLQLTLSNAQIIGAWDWDVLNDRVYADERFANLYSVDPQEAAQGAPFIAFLNAVHPDDRETVRREVDSAIATGELFATEHRLIQPDGSVRHILARGRCVPDSEGRLTRFPGVVVDVTDPAHHPEDRRRRHFRASPRYGRRGGVGGVLPHLWPVPRDERHSGGRHFETGGARRSAGGHGPGRERSQSPGRRGIPHPARQ